MSAAQKIRRRAIWAFGESINDAKVLKELVGAARPDLPPVDPKPRPIILTRQADLKKHFDRSGEIARLVRAARLVHDVIAVVAHRDLDDVEPADHLHERSNNEEALRVALQPVADLGIDVVVTVPAWEMEAWWLLWPEQISKHRPSWKKLKDRSGKRVDRIVNAKEALRQELMPKKDSKIPQYSESDAPYIAAQIRKDGVVRSPKGRAVAFERLIHQIDQIKI